MFPSHQQPNVESNESVDDWQVFVHSHNICSSVQFISSEVIGYCFKYTDSPFCLQTDELYYLIISHNKNNIV